MSGVGATNLDRNLFKKLYILPLLCLYILPLMMSVVDNQNNFQTNICTWVDYQEQESVVFAFC